LRATLVQGDRQSSSSRIIAYRGGGVISGVAFSRPPRASFETTTGTKKNIA
jgi:hypothetical protein